MLNVLSIDPGKRSIGLYIKSEKRNYSYTIKTNKCENEDDVYFKIYSDLSLAIGDNCINIVILEDYAYGLPANRQLYISEIKGLIKYVLYNYCKQPFYLIHMPIALWKMYTSNEITSIKIKNKKYINKINEIHKKDFKTADECDAFLMYVTFSWIWGGVIKTDSAQKVYKQILEIKNTGVKND